MIFGHCGCEGHRIQDPLVCQLPPHLQTDVIQIMQLRSDIEKYKSLLVGITCEPNIVDQKLVQGFDRTSCFSLSHEDSVGLSTSPQKVIEALVAFNMDNMDLSVHA